MNSLEDLVRRTYADHQHEAPSGDFLLGRVAGRRSRRRVRRAVAVVSVGLVGLAAAGVVAVLLPGSSSSSAPALAPPPVPAGTQPVSYQGVEVFVPASWKLNDVRCGQPQSDTAIFLKGIFPACGGTPVPGLTTVNLRGADMEDPAFSAATEPTTVDGEPALTGVFTGSVPTTYVLVVPGQQTLVTAQSPDPATAQALLATTHLLPIDRNGCVDRVADLQRRHTDRVGAADQLIPGTPTGLAVCRYSNSRNVGSVSLTDQVLTGEVTHLNALPEGTSTARNAPDPTSIGCVESSRTRGLVLRVSYADGDPLELVVHLNVCDPVLVGDSARTSQLTNAVIQELVHEVAYDGPLPQLD